MPKIKNITKQEMQEYKKACLKNYNKYYYKTVTKAKRQALKETNPKEKTLLEKTCPICNKMFTTYESRQKYCSEECKKIRNLQYQQEYRKTPEFKAKLKEYYKSENYKATRKKYASSEKGKATLKKYIANNKKTKAEKISNIKNILENYKNKITETDLKAILKNLK